MTDPGYHPELQIIATDDGTEIWLGDENKNYVTHGVGGVVVYVLPGVYYVQFGLGGEKHKITLTHEDASFLQRELEVNSDMEEMEEQAKEAWKNAQGQLDMDEVEARAYRRAGGEPLETDMDEAMDAMDEMENPGRQPEYDPAYGVGERSDFINGTTNATDDLYAVERELEELGMAFSRTGNQFMGQKLYRMSEVLAEARRRVNRATSREINRQFHEAQERSATILRAALAGGELAKGENGES